MSFFLEETFLDKNIRYQNASNGDYIAQLTIQLSENLNENIIIEYFTRLQSLFQSNQTNFNGWRYGLSLLLDPSIGDELRQLILNEYITLFTPLSNLDKNKIISELLFLLYHFSLKYSHNFSYKRNSLFKEDYDLSYKKIITDSKYSSTNDIEFIISENNQEEANTLLNAIKDPPTVNDQIAYLISDRTNIKPSILNKIKWYFEKDQYGVVRFSRLSSFLFEREVSSIIRIVNQKINNDYPQTELLETFSQEMISKNNFSILHYMIGFQKKDFSGPFLKKITIEPENESFSSKMSFDISKSPNESEFIDSLENQIIKDFFDLNSSEIVVNRLESNIKRYISIEKENEDLLNEIVKDIKSINDSKQLKEYNFSSKLQIRLTLLYLLKGIQIDHNDFLFCLGNTTKIKRLKNLGKICIISPHVLKYIKDNLNDNIKTKDRFKLHVLFFIISIKNNQQYDYSDICLCSELCKQLNSPFSPGIHRYFHLLLYFGNKIQLTETLYQVFMKFCQSIPDQCIWNENLMEYLDRLLYDKNDNVYYINKEDINNINNELKESLSKPNPVLDFYYSARLILQYNYLDNLGFINLLDKPDLIIDNYNRTCNINLKFVIMYCLCSDKIELENYYFVVRNLFRIFSKKKVNNNDLMYNIPMNIYSFLRKFKTYSYEYLLLLDLEVENLNKKFAVQVDKFTQARTVCNLLYNNGFINTIIGIYQNNTLEYFYVYSQGKWFKFYQKEGMLKNVNGIFDIFSYKQTDQRKIVLLFEYDKVSTNELKYKMLKSFLKDVYNKKLCLSQLLYPLFFFRFILQYPELIKDFKNLINDYVKLNNTTKCLFLSVVYKQKKNINHDYFEEILDLVLNTEMFTNDCYKKIVNFLLKDD